MYKEIAKLILYRDLGEDSILLKLSGIFRDYELDLAEKENLTAAEVINICNKKSGVLGLSGISSDFRDLVEAAQLILLLICTSVLVAFSSIFLGLKLSLVRIVLFLVGLVLAVILNFFIFYCVALLSFWLTDVHLLFGTVSVVLVVVSGGVLLLPVCQTPHPTDRRPRLTAGPAHRTPHYHQSCCQADR